LGKWDSEEHHQFSHLLICIKLELIKKALQAIAGPVLFPLGRSPKLLRKALRLIDGRFSFADCLSKGLSAIRAAGINAGGS